MRVGLSCILAVGCVSPESSPSDPGAYVMDGFSFVQEGLAGLPQPGQRAPLEQDLAFLVEQQIDLLISLTEQPADPERVRSAGLLALHLPVEDFQPPTLEQQRIFVERVAEARAEGGAVAVHCRAGLGRTGTLLATWLVADGYDPEQAIAEIRRLRPGSVETREQEDAIYAFAASWPLAR